MRHTGSRNLDEHVALIQESIVKSRRDPELRVLAMKIVNARYEYETHPRTGRAVPVIKAWGKRFRAPTRPQCAPRDETCEIERIWEFVVLNVRYVYDSPDFDDFATAQATLEMGGGDCDDFTILFCSLLNEVGFRCAARVIGTNASGGEWEHVYPMAGICPKGKPERYVPLDATVRGSVPGWQYDDVRRYRDYPL